MGKDIAESYRPIGTACKIMDISIFADTPFDDEDAMEDFLLANSLSHSLVATTLEQNGKFIATYPISSMGDESNWKDEHYRMHQDEFTLLGLTGMPDWTGFDFEDEAQWADWHSQHAVVHQAVNSVLGITT